LAHFIDAIARTIIPDATLFPDRPPVDAQRGLGERQPAEVLSWLTAAVPGHMLASSRHMMSRSLSANHAARPIVVIEAMPSLPDTPPWRTRRTHPWSSGSDVAIPDATLMTATRAVLIRGLRLRAAVD
jgi:hypothetical protein